MSLLKPKIMEFRTKVDLPEKLPYINHSDNILLMGSCFAENMGNLLLDSKFRCDVNPYGILYNPCSVSSALDQIVAGNTYTADELFFYGEQYHSYHHHGCFSAMTVSETLEKINNRLSATHHSLPHLNYLMLTWGTAWVYELIETGDIVGNCHKQPAKLFKRRKLTVQEVIHNYQELMDKLLYINPQLKLILTVSPIRHLKDGMHENQLSKAVLLLAIEQLQILYPETVFYFPSYEIVLDELRDYRFYAEDMLHPSLIAIQYLWKCFEKVFFSVETQAIIREINQIGKALKHKPFNPDSEEYKRFLQQILLKINRLREKYPNLVVEKELNLCHTLLK